MLTRIGNKLYRAGRYLERAEQIASYTRVHYLSTMDAPSPEFKDSFLKFLLECTQAKQAYFDTYPEAEEEKILHFLAIEKANPASILSAVTNARESIRGARDCISAGLWEHINCFYHAINDYDAEKLNQKSFDNFAQKVEKYSYTIKGYVHSNMIRNEEWKLLSLGFHLERAIQVSTLLLNKIQEIERNSSSAKPEVYEYYHMKSMLEGLDAYEMYKQHYKTHISRPLFMHFLVLNSIFPKSVAFNLNHIRTLCREHDENDQGEANIFLQQVALLVSEIEDVEPGLLVGNEKHYLENTLNNLHSLAKSLELEQVAF
ncbi:hypothetical protein D770_00330 [Flammeovirgaceae bacterium 311]|nr:hypothetical protein D770_00330 [Flammeovirgaceae bacterium 311]